MTQRTHSLTIHNIDRSTALGEGEGLLATNVLYELSRPDFHTLLSVLASITISYVSSSSASELFSPTPLSFSRSSL